MSCKIYIFQICRRKLRFGSDIFVFSISLLLVIYTRSRLYISDKCKSQYPLMLTDSDANIHQFHFFASFLTLLLSGFLLTVGIVWYAINYYLEFQALSDLCVHMSVRANFCFLRATEGVLETHSPIWWCTRPLAFCIFCANTFHSHSRSTNSFMCHRGLRYH